MKYKPGDTVKIKTWEELKKEFGISDGGNMIPCDQTFYKEMEDDLNEKVPDRILEIKDVYEYHQYKFMYQLGYHMKNINWDWTWTDDMIKELVIFESIHSRFEILDL